MSQYFNNKTIWITGASSGIGEALTLAFAQAGAHIVLSGRRVAALQAVADKCPSNTKTWVQPLDVTDLERIPKLTQEVIQQTGGIDILVNNAGISQRSRVIDTQMEVLDRLMQINFYGAAALTKAVLPHMLERGSGHFVVMSSLAGKFGTPLRSGYCASKHALHGFFDALRAETVHQGIQVTTFCPGYIKTQISFNAVLGDGAKQNKMDEGQANGMLPEQFARKALHAIAKGKKEVAIGGKETLGIYFKRFFPNQFFKFISRVNVT